MKIRKRQIHFFILLFAMCSLLFHSPSDFEAFAASPSDIGAADAETDGNNGFDRLTNVRDVSTFTVGSSTYAIAVSKEGVQMIDISDPKKAPFAGLPTIEDAVKSGAFLCGPPERVIEQLKKVEEDYPGLERIGVSHPVGTPQAVILEQMEWFAKEVMPAFSGLAEAAVLAD